MIPVLLVFGLVLGRWWKSALLAGFVGWPLVLLLGGVLQEGAGPLSVDIFLAAYLGLANVAVGVGVHQAGLALVRLIRRRGANPGTPGPERRSARNA